MNYNNGFTRNYQYYGNRSNYDFSPIANNGRSWNQRQQSRWNAQPINTGKKHSGCVSGVTKDGKQYIRGWKFDKQNGLRSFIAGPNKDTKQHKSKAGRVWENWTCKVTEASGRHFLVSCLYDQMTNKVIINDMGFVMNPKGGRGGYVGRFTIPKGN